MAAEVIYAHHIDVDNNQIKNAKIHQLASDPVSPTESLYWYNTTEKRIKYYNGTSTQTIANLSDITGALLFIGGYNATTNTPDLTAPTAGVVKSGHYYVVTVAGTFFGQTLEVGDSLFAKVDDPSTLADWVLVEKNDSAASETIQGTIEIATQAEVTTGTDDTRAITPLKLITHLQTNVYVRKVVFASVNIGTTPGVQTLTHNLNSLNVQVEVYDTTTGARYSVAVVTTTVNACTIEANGVTRTVRANVIG